MTRSRSRRSRTAVGGVARRCRRGLLALASAWKRAEADRLRCRQEDGVVVTSDPDDLTRLDRSLRVVPI